MGADDAGPPLTDPPSTPAAWGGLPVPDDTVDLRSGPELSARLLALLPLVGQWSGTGHLVDFASRQSVPIGLAVAFAHDGRDFLAYESRSWLMSADADAAADADGPHGVAGVSAPIREVGFWRRGFNQDAVEVALADSAGAVTVLTGVAGDARWELATDAVAAAPTGRAVQPERRLYAVVRDALMVITEQKIGEVWTPQLNAQLFRMR